MFPDRLPAIDPTASQMLDPGEICRIGVTGLSKLLADLSAQDPALLERLRALISVTHPKFQAGPSPTPNENFGEFSGYMVGASPAMMRVFESIRRYAASSAPVLITGESGTGKELVARAIHERSPWKNGPFVAINCGAIPTTLIGSELFGYEKGAFTGASTRKIGRIEAAANGTVFLDEIGDLPLETQVHLLRFLQERTIERIGSCKSVTINTRVVAATNINLHEAVAARRFREDLFYRLNVLTLALPPLRERANDVRLLTKFFLKHFADELGRPELELSPEAEDCIAAHPWPGNVRELIACIRRAVVMADASIIGIGDLGLAPSPRDTVARSQDLLKARADTEAMLVRQTLERNNFNIKQSAMELRVSRMTLYRLIQKHNIAIERTPNRNLVTTGTDSGPS